MLTVKEANSKTGLNISMIRIMEISIFLVFGFTNCRIVVNLNSKCELKKNEGNDLSPQEKRNCLDTLP